MTKRLIAVIALSGSGVIAAGSAVQAGSPTCSDEYGWKNHGEHVLDYVNSTGAAGGAPSHPAGHAKPGASFCLDQANSQPRTR